MKKPISATLLLPVLALSFAAESMAANEELRPFYESSCFATRLPRADYSNLVRFLQNGGSVDVNEENSAELSNEQIHSLTLFGRVSICANGARFSASDLVGLVQSGRAKLTIDEGSVAPALSKQDLDTLAFFSRGGLSVKISSTRFSKWDLLDLARANPKLVLAQKTSETKYSMTDYEQIAREVKTLLIVDDGYARFSSFELARLRSLGVTLQLFPFPNPSF